MKIVAKPWEPQDLLDDLQGIIDEESDNYLNTRRTTLETALAYLKEYFDKDANVLTNADRIRAMSDRELAEFLTKKFTDNEAMKAASKGDVLTATYLSEISCAWFHVWMQWLRQPAEDDC